MEGREFPLQVLPKLPDGIARMSELASDLWFSWHRPTRKLFHMLDHELWWEAGRNPKVFLQTVDQNILRMAAENETFLAAYRQVLAEFDAYHEQGVAPYKAAHLEQNDLIAYFCAEYGFHESFPVYSGGLGILAGDHCKTASDMRLPFVAVGLMYRQGYFVQKIDGSGQQIADYAYIEAENAPVMPALDTDGNKLIVRCELPGRELAIRVWRVEVGRVPVLLLDTDVGENSDEDREITRILYGGDIERRLQQEIVLGIGGVRALRGVGMAPVIWHINEGHAAFLTLERIRERVADGLVFAAAVEAVAADTVFTTHTPVQAGHDAFPRELLLSYFENLIRELGISDEAFLGLAASNTGFDMTRLAIAGSHAVNGVSRIHARVSSEICADAWPEIPPRENPVGYVTNGVHVPTFMQQEWVDLLEEHLGPSWRYQLMDRTLMDTIMDIPDPRFWYANQRVKSDMMVALRSRLSRQHARNRSSEAHLQRMLKYLDPENPDVLTIGFGRRFATYKRATLLFNDLDWFREIVDHDTRPVVFIFAGKAHPADEPGQQLLREIHRVANLPSFIGKILLVEGYDIGLGRLLTAGVDIWLNTPIYPMEASGTSGMKAAINGTVNLSVLDGWWAEAYDGTNGWAIPPSADSDDDEQRDRRDARTLYEILQDQVIPLYYSRDGRADHSPGWVQVCKRSMASVLPNFNSNRVLHDYACRLYGPAAEHGRQMTEDGCRGARELAEWKARIRKAWPGVALHLAGSLPERTDFDTPFILEVEAELGGLQPSDLRVECMLRRKLCSDVTVPVREFARAAPSEDGVRYFDDEVVVVAPFEAQQDRLADGRCLYRLKLQVPWCGALAYEIRAVPRHPRLSHPYEMGLMRHI